MANASVRSLLQASLHLFQPYALLLLLGLGLTLPGCNDLRRDNKHDNNSQQALTRALATDATAGFARATQVQPFVFPRDHGPHPDFRTEWWYFTGNLNSAAGRHFGYELTLFRHALQAATTTRQSRWAMRDVYFAHFAITDTDNKKFYYQERLTRHAAGLAGANANPFRVWIDDWRISADSKADFPWSLRAQTDNFEIDLQLSSIKPLVLQGNKGLSRKGPSQGNASYYYSYTRLQASGTVRVGKQTHKVSGLSWMDREWSTSALSKDQQGWDWFALQLQDGYELMFYRIRGQDNTSDPFSAGALIDPQGRSKLLGAQDVTIEVLKHWHSPRGGRYPSAWRIHIPSVQLELQIRPVIPDQELVTRVRYWEGAVTSHGTHGGQAITGRGYVELTGYAAR